MIKEILIALVAVVVVILIIAFAALRFLRADDSDTFDDMPDEPRKQGRGLADSQPMPAPVQRHRPMRAEPARDQPRAQPRTAERAADERQPAGYRDQRPASSERRGAGAGQRVPVAAAGSTRPARQPDPDSQATAKWDAMSDVDYWTELAAEKPMTATSPTATTPAAASRRSPDRKPADSRPAQRNDQLPVRQRSQPRTPEPATQSIAALARLAAQPPRTGQPPATGPRPAMRPDQPRPEQPRTASRPASRGHQAPAPAPVSYPGAQGRLPLPLDEDPLTSPSFPAINASDSRSYRTRQPRSPQPDSGRDHNSAGYGQQPQASQPAQLSQPPQASQPAQQFNAPAMPDRSASAPNGYPVQPAPAVPAANPYGSFVAAPQAGYGDASTGHLDSSAYGTGYAGPSQPPVPTPAPDPGWYPNGNVNGSANGSGYYDASYYDAGYHGTSPGGAGAGDPGYASSSGYTGRRPVRRQLRRQHVPGVPGGQFPARRVQRRGFPERPA